MLAQELIGFLERLAAQIFNRTCNAKTPATIMHQHPRSADKKS